MKSARVFVATCNGGLAQHQCIIYKKYGDFQVKLNHTITLIYIRVYLDSNATANLHINQDNVPASSYVR